jgi:hypothetical protein
MEPTGCDTASALESYCCQEGDCPGDFRWLLILQ